MMDDRMISGQSRAVVIALCAAAVALDGFDTQAIDFTGPLISDERGFARAQLGLLFSAGICAAASALAARRPASLALASRRRYRTSAAAMLHAAFPPGGAVLGALVSAPILDHHGWRGVFVMGAILPIVIALVIAACLKSHAEPAMTADTKISVRSPVTDGRLPLTLALWLAFVIS